MSMSFEPRHKPEFRDHSSTKPVTERSLIKEMTAFACNNPNFRRGEIDRTSIIVNEATFFTIPEILTPEQRELYEEWGDLPAEAESQVQTTYQFVAQREHVGRQTVLAFNAGIEASHSHIELPPYIRDHLNATGMKTEDVGPVTFAKTFEFSIATNYRYLSAEESFEYLDDDNECIYSGTSKEESINHEPYYAITADTEGDVIVPKPVQIVSRAIIDRMAHERIEVDSPEQAAQLWAAVPDELYLPVAEQVYDANLMLAHGMFQRLKLLVRQQAGLR